MKIPYDLLFADATGTKLYRDFIFDHAQGQTLIECACGSGDLLVALSERYDCWGIDRDAVMIETAQTKYPAYKNKFVVADFKTYNTGHYDTLVCVGDSLNYMLSERELLEFVDNSLKLSDHLILDCHHPARLQEFKAGYEEEGRVGDHDYAYQILSDGDRLSHIINYLDGTFTHIEQWVFEPQLLITAYETRGCEVRTYTDFEEPGLQAEGEKVMFVVQKERVS